MRWADKKQLFQTSSGLSDHHNRPTQGSIVPRTRWFCLPVVLVSSQVCPVWPHCPIQPCKVPPGISAGRALMGPRSGRGEFNDCSDRAGPSQGGGKSVNCVSQILDSDTFTPQCLVWAGLEGSSIYLFYIIIEYEI